MRFAITLLAATLLTQVASGSTLVYVTTLNAATEEPPTGGIGTGAASVTIDNVLNTLEVNVVFSGLTSGDAAAHIHCCTSAAGSGNVGVATTLPTFTGFPNGVTSGSYDHVFDLTSPSSYNPSFVTANGSVTAAEAALLAGLASDKAYLNIHTTNFPGGEIRGFLLATPEPASWSLGVLALVGLAISRLSRVLRLPKNA